MSFLWKRSSNKRDDGHVRDPSFLKDRSAYEPPEFDISYIDGNSFIQLSPNMNKGHEVTEKDSFDSTKQLSTQKESQSRLVNNKKSIPTIKEHEKITDESTKEIFSLKLKIFYLEDRLQQLTPEAMENSVKENVELKVRLKEYSENIEFYKKEVLRLGNLLESVKEESRKRADEGIVKQLNSTVEGLKHEFSKKEENYQGLIGKIKGDFNKLNATYENIKKENLTLHNRVNECLHELDILKDNIVESDSLLKAKEGELEEYQKMISKQEYSISQKDARIESLTKKLESNQDENSSVVRNIKEELVKRNEEISILCSKDKEAQNLVSDLQNKIQGLNRQFEEAKGREREYLHRISVLEEQNAMILGDYNGLKEDNKKNADSTLKYREELNNECAVMRKQIEELQEDNESLINKLNKFTDENRQLSVMNNEKEKKILDLSSQLGDRLDLDIERKRLLVKVEELECQNLLVHTNNTELSNKNLELDGTNRGLSERVKSLQNKISIMENRYREARNKETVEFATKMEEESKEKEDLLRQIERMKHDNSVLIKKTDDMNNEILDLVDKVKIYTENNVEFSNNIVSLKKEVSFLSQKTENLREENRQLSKNKEDLEKKVQEKNEEFENFIRESQKKDYKESNMMVLNQRLKQENSGLKKEVQEIDSLKHRLSSLLEENREIKMETSKRIDILQNEIKDCEKTITESKRITKSKTTEVIHLKHLILASIEDFQSWAENFVYKFVKTRTRTMNSCIVAINNIRERIEERENTPERECGYKGIQETNLIKNLLLTIKNEYISYLGSEENSVIIRNWVDEGMSTNNMHISYRVVQKTVRLMMEHLKENNLKNRDYDFVIEKIYKFLNDWKLLIFNEKKASQVVFEEESNSCIHKSQTINLLGIFNRLKYIRSINFLQMKETFEFVHLLHTQIQTSHKRFSVPWQYSFGIQNSECLVGGLVGDINDNSVNNKIEVIRDNIVKLQNDILVSFQNAFNYKRVHVDNGKREVFNYLNVRMEHTFLLLTKLCRVISVLSMDVKNMRFGRGDDMTKRVRLLEVTVQKYKDKNISLERKTEQFYLQLKKRDMLITRALKRLESFSVQKDLIMKRLENINIKNKNLKKT